MTRAGVPWKVTDEVNMDRWVGRSAGPLRRNAEYDDAGQGIGGE